MKKIIPILLLIAAIAAGGWYWSRRSAHDNGNTLSISGNIELTEVDISFKIPGKLVELNVDEGTFVKKGTVIARIDREQVEQQRSRDEAGLSGAQSQLAQANTTIQWQRQTLESEVALRRAEL